MIGAADATWLVLVAGVAALGVGVAVVRWWRRRAAARRQRSAGPQWRPRRTCGSDSSDGPPVID